MTTKDIVIIILTIILVAIVVGYIYFALMPDTNDDDKINETNITNNATNVSLENSNENTQVSTQSSKSSSSQKEYDDWQKDYETGEYDEDGNPIYRSEFSTSGGQYEPGVYEAYWSANGPISEERIG